MTSPPRHTQSNLSRLGVCSLCNHCVCRHGTHTHCDRDGGHTHTHTYAHTRIRTHTRIRRGSYPAAAVPAKTQRLLPLVVSEAVVGLWVRRDELPVFTSLHPRTRSATFTIPSPPSFSSLAYSSHSLLSPPAEAPALLLASYPCSRVERSLSIEDKRGRHWESKKSIGETLEAFARRWF